MINKMTLTTEAFACYQSDTLKHDGKVRLFSGLPPDRYFTVNIWPVAGEVRVSHLPRTVKAVKISKSP